VTQLRDCPVVFSIDQGTSSTKAIALNADGHAIANVSRRVAISHPRPGWVEQDANAIFGSVEWCIAALAAQVGVPPAAIAISSQRESAVAWETSTGRALQPILGWQDRRTRARARELAATAARQQVRRISGLPLDPMFSALKFQWMLDEIDPRRERAMAGEITLGTVDAWLVHRLTGERRIEVGNASRTQLLDHETGQWSAELASIFNIPPNALPRVAHSDEATGAILAGPARGVRVTGILADSHAALFGHGIRTQGHVKATYGTGSSIMGLVDQPRLSAGVDDTIAWSKGESIAHAFEGNILATGAVLEWLGHLLGVSAGRVADLAESADGSSTVDFVPAFAGLAAPWWDEDAVGMISGLTLDTSPAQLARAALEAIALQIEDVLSAAEDAGVPTISVVHADGGPSSNDWLMQLQADLSGRTITRESVADMSARGAGWFAGAAADIWATDEIPWLSCSAPKKFYPRRENTLVRERQSQWHEAIARARMTPATKKERS
jgi:glycerol kinase